MTVVVLSGDLLIASRVLSQADAAGRAALRVDDPTQLPPPADVDVLFVDWADRREDWARLLTEWSASAKQLPDSPKIILFGPHTDLDAHAAAREANLGPMRARSKLMADLPGLLRPR